MYTHPNHTRKGIDRLIIALCEQAARAEGFTQMELVATLSGEPLYRACGFEPYEHIVDDRGGAGVPLIRMRKSLASSVASSSSPHLTLTAPIPKPAPRAIRVPQTKPGHHLESPKEQLLDHPVSNHRT